MLPDFAIRDGRHTVGTHGHKYELIVLPRYDAHPEAREAADRIRNLLNAAPDLLEALEDLLAAIGGEESTDIWCVDARAAIAKARGR